MAQKKKFSFTWTDNDVHNELRLHDLKFKSV